MFEMDKLLFGIAMLMTNMGAKYLHLDINIYQEVFFKHALIRRLTMFSVFYVATQDLKMAFFLTAAFVILGMGLLNPQSKMCVVPPQFLNHGVLIDNGDNHISKEEYDRAKEMVGIYEKNMAIK